MEKRISNLGKLLEKNQALLIYNDDNRFYFTGMRSSAGTLLVTKEESYLFIDFRYFEKAKETVKGSCVELSTNRTKQLKEKLKKHKIDTIFFESDFITVSQFEQLKKSFDSFNLDSSDFFAKKIKEMRSIKEREEINFIKEAQAITDKAFLYILNRLKTGVSEKEIMLDLEFFMRKNGSDGIAFDSIVVSGKNSSLPHGVPTDKKLEYGDFVTMDFGAYTFGYCSDMTRTVAIGSVTEKQEEVYNTVLTAQREALSVIKPDVKCCEVDKIARDIIDASKYKGCFGHALGHSLGIYIHEPPAFNTKDNTLLKAGMVMTVEPGIYIENEFGVRIEDMVLVTENGCENLTAASKELIVL